MRTPESFPDIQALHKVAGVSVWIADAVPMFSMDATRVVYNVYIGKKRTYSLAETISALSIADGYVSWRDTSPYLSYAIPGVARNTERLKFVQDAIDFSILTNIHTFSKESITKTYLTPIINRAIGKSPKANTKETKILDELTRLMKEHDITAAQAKFFMDRERQKMGPYIVDKTDVYDQIKWESRLNSHMSTAIEQYNSLFSSF